MSNVPTIREDEHHKKFREYVGDRICRTLLLQDRLLEYMTHEFNFGHLKNSAVIGDSMHLHAYKVEAQENKSYQLVLSHA